MKVTIDDILKARERISSHVHKTEMDLSSSTSAQLGCEVYYKYENLQKTGSFKIRGAANKILSLTPEEKKRGVIACSAGNHAQGVALSAKWAGTKATIVMPVGASLNKLAATRAYGAEVILHGEIVDDSMAKAREIAAEKGLVFVHPYEDELIIAGQGTLGLEMIEQVPDLDSVFVAIGGGGLISGISTAIKARNPKCRIIGVQSEQAPGMARLFHHQSIEKLPSKISTIADGIAIKNPSRDVYESFISKHVDEVVTVSDDEIAEAIVFLLERTKNLVEGAGAASAAALLSKKVNPGKKTCALLCGANIDLNIVAKVIERGMIKQGRLAELSVIVDDAPGSLARLTAVLARERANILQVHHDRVEQGLFLREVSIDFQLDTSGPEHIEKIKAALREAGGRIQ